MPNPNTPIVNLGTRYVNNLMMSWESGSLIRIVNGQARDNRDENDIVIGDSLIAPLNNNFTTISKSIIGAGGLDTGTLAADTNYYVYVIGDSTGNNPGTAIFADNNNAPQFPLGYDIARRIGCIRTDGSSNFLKFYQFGRGTDRWYYYDVPISVLVAGASTVFDDVDLNDAIPFIPLDGETEVMLQYTYTPAAAANRAHFNSANSTATNGMILIGGGVAAAQEGVVIVPTESAEIIYKVAAGDTLSLSVIGYKDYLSAPQ